MEYIDYLYLQGKPETTIKVYNYDIQRMLRTIKKKVAKITQEDLYKFLSCLAKEGIKPVTRARYISSMKSYFTYLKDLGMIKNNPAERIHKPKIDKNESIYLNYSEAYNLLSEAKKCFKRHSRRNYAIVILFMNTGIRLGELCKINLEDIDFLDGKIKIHGKGQKERIIYLNKNSISAITNYTDRKTGALFLSERGNRIGRREVQYIIKQVVEAAGLKDITPHKLRHTFATLMYQNGTDLRCLQKILGHENLSTTEIYTHVRDEQMKNAIDKLGRTYAKLSKRD